MSLLQSLMRRFENLHDAKKEIDEDLKELMQEVDSNGFEKKAFKEAFKRLQQGEQFDLFDEKVNLYIAEIKRGSTQARGAHVSETPPANFTIDITATAHEVKIEPLQFPPPFEATGETQEEELLRFEREIRALAGPSEPPTVDPAEPSADIEPTQTADVIDFPAPTQTQTVDDGSLPVIFRGETIRVSADKFAELKAAGALKVHSIGNVETTVDPREDVAA